MSTHHLPSALDNLDALLERIGNRRLAVFLDYDGTLTPIVERPEQAELGDAMRRQIRRLAQLCAVAVVSGRDLDDVRRRAGIDGIVYAGSHGFDIEGRLDRPIREQQGTEYLPELDKAERQLHRLLDGVAGCHLERKRFSIAVHYRQVREADMDAVENAVDEILEEHPRLRKSGGKKVFEVQPDMDWDKGKAVCRLLEVLDLDRPDVLPLYLGDDLTDEDAFGALREQGIGIRVGNGPSRTRARYALRDPQEVERFFAELIRALGAR